MDSNHHDFSGFENALPFQPRFTLIYTIYYTIFAHHFEVAKKPQFPRIEIQYSQKRRKRAVKLKQIENIIDSVDPYHLVKDMGFKLISTEGEENDLYTLRLLDRSIRVMPNGYLNLDLFSNPQTQAFAAGTAIDLLAFYMRNNYEKAFKLFFTYYMPVLKTKLVHEPEYIARLVKATFIKRKNVLNFIISKLLTDQPGGLPQCGAWKSKYGIDNLKGFAYCDTSAGIFSALNFLVDNRSLEYDEAVTFEHADPSHPFSDFINNHLFKESKEWVVVPYLIRP